VRDKKLNIAFLVSSFPIVSETFIVNQICDLIDRGHEIRIFAFNRKNEEVIHQKIKDYSLLKKTVFYEQAYTSKLKRYFPFLKFQFLNSGNVNLKKISANFRFKEKPLKAFNLDFFYKNKWILDFGYFDIIHVHFGPNAIYIAELKELGFFQKTKMVTTFHGYDVNPAYIEDHKIKYDTVFKESALLTVNTTYTKLILQKLTRNRIEILPVGLDTTFFKKISTRKSKDFNILFLGRLVSFKAPELAVEIFKILKDRNTTEIFLTIIGEGERKDALQQLIKDYKLEQYIRLKGALAQEEIVKEMEQADVFISPGVYDADGRAENQGLVIQEAQAMELPVIVSDAGGMKYGIKDGETGFVVKEKGVNAFADKIEMLILNEEARIKMGKKGREYVVQYYDSKILGNKLEKLYYQLLN